MPDIPNEHIHSVAILLRPHPVSGANDPIGTAFLVQTRTSVVPPTHVYLVTCEHCISDATMVRFHDGTVVALGREDWTLAPDGDDLAVMDITDRLPSNFPSDWCIALGLVAQDRGNYQLGDDIYMLGLHVNERDNGTNQPRARFGNISAWASNKAPIMQGNGNARPTHIGDMRSRTGFSGSPVFVYYELHGLDADVKTKAALLGIHSGQFPDRIQIVSGQREYPAEIPSSMTKIVPAWTLGFIETDPGFAALRARREADET